MRFFFLRIFPFIFIAVGATVAFFGVRGLVRAKASVDWPSTHGKVLESSVERQTSHRTKGRSSTTFHAEIGYEFTVNGKEFRGNRVAYGDYGSGDSSLAHEVVNRYPKGRDVTVHYMPDHPEEDLLEPGVTRQAWFSPGFGLVFFVVGCLMAVLLPKTMNKQG